MTDLRSPLLGRPLRPEYPGYRTSIRTVSGASDVTGAGIPSTSRDLNQALGTVDPGLQVARLTPEGTTLVSALEQVTSDFSSSTFFSDYGQNETGRAEYAADLYRSFDSSIDRAVAVAEATESPVELTESLEATRLVFASALSQFVSDASFDAETAFTDISETAETDFKDQLEGILGREVVTESVVVAPTVDSITAADVTGFDQALIDEFRQSESYTSGGDTLTSRQNFAVEYIEGFALSSRSVAQSFSGAVDVAKAAFDDAISVSDVQIYERLDSFLTEKEQETVESLDSPRQSIRSSALQAFTGVFQGLRAGTRINTTG